MIGSRLSSRSPPPFKVARTDDAPQVISATAMHEAGTSQAPRSIDPQTCPRQGTPPVATPETSLPGTASAPPSSPPVGTSAEAPFWSRPMLGNPAVIRERLARFVYIPEVNQMNTLSTERVVNMYLEGLAQVRVCRSLFSSPFLCLLSPFCLAFFQVSTLSLCLSSRAYAHGTLRQDHVAVQDELLAARGKIVELEDVGRASEGELVLAHEKASRLESELSATRERDALREEELVVAHKKVSRLESELLASREGDALRKDELVGAHERVTKLEAELLTTCRRDALREAELSVTRERAMLREAALEAELKAAHEKASQAEEKAAIAERDLANGLADAFIDGYDELREKISAAFPDIDVSGFLPTGAYDEDEGGSDEGEGDAEDDEEGVEDDHESS